ncbi:hypothetical protein ABIB90_008199 [Bradyrhizobium sp. JR4.1]|uniref:porin n=1 Tax=Bradyrhizobium sp. JR4.1 TaxID=3156372 RepID=UPI003395B005
MRYNNTAEGYICGTFVVNLALSSGAAGCNPDFNYAVVGVRTGWTSVKGLTFSGGLSYMILDQKFTANSKAHSLAAAVTH